MKAIVVTEVGGPDVLQAGETELEPPAADQVRVRVAYAGVNFLDLHHRSGTYRRELPFVPGREGSGTVTECGSDVTSLRVGDRVAFAMHEGGTYAEEAVLPAWLAAPVPDSVELSTAAAVMLQGLTAISLVDDEAAVHQGQNVLVHSAAGGTGSLVVQLARHCGARVLALTSTLAKAEAALLAGASVAGVYPEEGFSQWVRDHTDGRGVDVVFGAVGGPTFVDDLNSLAVRGRLILYGRSGGQFPTFDPSRLADGCLSITYSRLSYYVGDHSAYLSHAAKLFDLVSRGVVAPLSVAVLPALSAGAAHAALEARTSIGKHLLDMSEGFDSARPGSPAVARPPRPTAGGLNQDD